jgi:hypothetical protein
MDKIVKTSFGAVDGQALEKLQDSFDTTELLRAVDAIDQVRYRDDDLRQDMQAYEAVKPLESLLTDPDEEWEEEQAQQSP